MIIFRSLPRGAVVLAGLLTLCVMLWADLSSASAQTSASALPQHVTSDEPPEDIDDVLNRVFGQLQTEPGYAIHMANLRGEIGTEGKLTAEELTRLDFSLPGDPGFDETSPYSVLRMLKKNARSLYPDNVFVTQKDLDRLTKIKGTRLIFNVRRVRSQGATPSKTTVYWLLPNFDPQFCGFSIVKASGLRLGPYPFIAPKGFVIAPDNHTIVEDEQELDPQSVDGQFLPNACIYMPDGQVYWASFLFRL